MVIFSRFTKSPFLLVSLTLLLNRWKLFLLLLVRPFSNLIEFWTQILNCSVFIRVRKLCEGWEKVFLIRL